VFVPTWLYAIVFYGLVATAAGALYMFYRSQRRTVALVVFAAAGILALLVRHVATDVIRVHDADGGVAADRVKWLGTPDFDRTPGGDNFPDEPRTTLIVNDSAKNVRLELVSYGKNAVGLGGLLDATVIPPGKMLVTSRIEHIGPGDRPPDEIEVVDGDLQMLRPWLTW
jgi:hypothetical protein